MADTPDLSMFLQQEHGPSSPPPEPIDPVEMQKAMALASSSPSHPSKWNLYDDRSPKQTLTDYQTQHDQPDLSMFQAPPADKPDLSMFSQQETAQAGAPQPGLVGKIKDTLGIPADWGEENLSRAIEHPIAAGAGALTGLGNAIGQGGVWANAVLGMNASMQMPSDIAKEAHAAGAAVENYMLTMGPKDANGREVIQNPALAPGGSERASYEAGQALMPVVGALAAPVAGAVLLASGPASRLAGQGVEALTGSKYAGEQTAASVEGISLLASFGLGSKGSKPGISPEILRAINDYVKANPEVLKSFYQSQVGHLSTTLDAALGDRQVFKPGDSVHPTTITPDTIDIGVPAGETTEQAVSRVVTEGGNLGQILDLAAGENDYPATAGHFQALAQRYQRTIADLGLDQVTIKHDPTLTYNGHYDPTTDTVTFRDETPTVATVLHETGHAITSKLAKLYEVAQAITDSAGRQQFLNRYSPEIQAQVAKIGDVDAIRKLAIQKMAAKEGITAAEMTHRLTSFDPQFKDYRQNPVHYGLTDIHEFLADTPVRTALQQALRDLPVTRAEIPPAVSRTKPMVYNAWQAFTKAFRNMLTGTTHETILSHAMERTMGVFDSIDYQGRLAEPGERGLSSPELRAVAAQHDMLMDRSTQVTMYKLAQLLKERTTDSEVMTRATAMMPDSQPWQDFLTRNIPRMLDQDSHVIRTFGSYDAWQKMNPTERLLTATPLSTEDFMTWHQQEAERQAKAAGMPEGLTYLASQFDLFDEGTFILPPQQLKWLKGTKLGGMVMKFLQEKGEEYRSLGAQLEYQGEKLQRPFYEAPIAIQEKISKVALYYQDLNAISRLKQAGLRWPTAEELAKDHGLSPSEIGIYQGLANSYEFAERLINEALAKRGQAPIEHIPGFMPHFFEGAYRVIIKEIRPDGQERTVAIKPFDTKWGALGYVKKLNDGKLDNAQFGLRYRPTLEEGSMLPYVLHERQYRSTSIPQAYSEALSAYRNIDSLDPDFMMKLDKIENAASMGTLAHILPREGVDGWLGQHGFDSGLLSKAGLNATNNRILKIPRQYLKNVVEFYKNTMFVKEVSSRLVNQPIPDGAISNYGAYLDKAKRLTEYVREYEANFTGENFNHLYRWIEDEFRPGLKLAGLDPEIVGRFAMSLRNFLSLTKLRAYTPFLLSNVFQPGHMLSILELAESKMHQAGMSYDPTRPARAMSSAITNWKDPNLLASIAWARDNHVVDPRMEYQAREKDPSKAMQIFNKATGAGINPQIEYTSREFAFAWAHEYYKEIYPNDPESIRRAAQQAMEMVMVNYDRTSRPLMYQNFGIVGKLMSPFAVFRNAYIGNNWLMLRNIADGIKNKNPNIVSHLLPLMTYMTVYMTMAGAVNGVFLADEYDSLMRLWNEMFPEMAQPTAQEYMMESMNKLGAPEWMKFGAISGATRLIPGLGHGIDMSSSMKPSALDSTASSALMPVIDAFARLAFLAGKAGLHELFPDTVNPLTGSDVYKHLGPLVPSAARGAWEYEFHGGHPEVASKGTDLKGYIPREPEDWHSLIFGKPSMEEAERRINEAAIDRADKARSSTLQGLVNAAVNSTMGTGSQMDSSSAKQAAIARGMTDKEFNEAVAEEVINRTFTNEQRDAANETIRGVMRRLKRSEMTND